MDCFALKGGLLSIEDIKYDITTTSPAVHRATNVPWLAASGRAANKLVTGRSVTGGC